MFKVNAELLQYIFLCFVYAEEIMIYHFWRLFALFSLGSSKYEKQYLKREF